MIKVKYLAVDGYRKTAKFKTLAGAQKFAHKAVGSTPDIGSNYAVSFDGVGRIKTEGCTLAELFPATVEARPAQEKAPCYPTAQDMQAFDDSMLAFYLGRIAADSADPKGDTELEFGEDATWCERFAANGSKEALDNLDIELKKESN